MPTLSPQKKVRSLDIRRIVITGLLCAVAYGVTYVTRMLPNVNGFLSYDAKDAIIMLAAFIFGPLQGLLMSFIVSFLEMITYSSTGIIGFLMNVIASSLFVCTAAAISKRGDFKRTLTGLICGCLAMTAGMLLWNYIVTPFYMGVPRQAVVDMLLPVFLPFNLVKSGLNACLAALLYKTSIPALTKSRLIPPQPEATKKSSTVAAITVSAFGLITFVLLLMVLMDVL